MKTEKALAQKLKILQGRISMVQALVGFLKRYPDIAPRCTIKNLWYGPGLEFEDLAFIKAITPRKDSNVKLRLEKFSESDEEECIICEDISGFSPDELASALLLVGIDLSKPPDSDKDEVEEES